MPQHKGRRIIKNADQAEYDAARQRATTKADALVRRQHPRVARQLADRVGNHGGRRTRYRGQWRVPRQYVRMGMVVHSQRLVKRRSVQEAPAILEPV